MIARTNSYYQDIYKQQGPQVGGISVVSYHSPSEHVNQSTYQELFQIQKVTNKDARPIQISVSANRSNHAKQRYEDMKWTILPPPSLSTRTDLHHATLALVKSIHVNFKLLTMATFIFKHLAPESVPRQG